MLDEAGAEVLRMVLYQDRILRAYDQQMKIWYLIHVLDRVEAEALDARLLDDPLSPRVHVVANSRVTVVA